jgi:hypothetical protein
MGILVVVLSGLCGGQVNAQDWDDAGAAHVSLTYIPGSSAKVEQVLGDCDWVAYDPKPTTPPNLPPGPVGPCKPTTSQTITRAAVMGNDVGYSFENNGKLMFLFGDTIGGLPGAAPPTSIDYHAADPMAWSVTRRGEDGLLINFLMQSGGASPLFVTPPPQPNGLQPSTIPNGAAVAMGTDDVPNSGINLDGQVYLVVNTNANESLKAQGIDPHLAAFSVLVRFDEATSTFTSGRTLSQSYYPLPPVPPPLVTGTPGHFVFTALHEFPEGLGNWGFGAWEAPLDGLESWEPGVLIFGTGQYRASSLYLSYVPSKDFWSGLDSQGHSTTRYFTGLKDGHATWSSSEADAQPLFYDNPTNLPTSPDPGTVGNASISYSSDLGLWLLTYDGGRNSDQTTGVYFTYARKPWGPWSTPQLIFNACRDNGYGAFIYYYRADPSNAVCTYVPTPPTDPSGPAGPIIGTAPYLSGPNGPFGESAFTTSGGPYAPEMIERFTEMDGDMLRIYYTLSTFNPYTIVKMSSEFTITRTPWWPY